MSKIYIAGPMAGVADYKERFARAEKKLRSMGHTVINPAVLPEGLAHEDYMRICLAMVDAAELVCMLPGWSKSAGAGIEYAYAKYNGKGTMEYVPCVSQKAPR